MSPQAQPVDSFCLCIQLIVINLYLSEVILVNENVQWFLEQNIKLVDDCNWKELFSKSQDPNEGLTNNDFILLLEILKSIGIPQVTSKL